MSPLHYQKVLRLQEARRLMLSRDDGREHRKPARRLFSARRSSAANTAASSERANKRTSPDCARTSGPRSSRSYSINVFQGGHGLSRAEKQLKKWGLKPRPPEEAPRSLWR